MYISKIHIKNFKGIKELTLHCNKGLNILVGENSAGKSTIIEAIRLWRMALDKFIQASEPTKLYKTKKSKVHKFLYQPNLEFLRVMHLDNIFCEDSNYAKKAKNMTIGLSFLNQDNQEQSISFKFVVPTEGTESLRLHIIEEEVKLENFFGNFISLLELLYLSPIFNLVNSEPVYEDKYFKILQRKGLGNQVLRNIITTLSKTKLGHLNTSLTSIFPNLNKFEEKEKENKSNKDGLLELIAKGDPADIGSQGSGVLQTIYLLASIYHLERKNRHIALLLDEPDSHLNGKVQRALIDALRRLSQKEGESLNMQTFIVTHNEKLIYSAGTDELLYIEKDATEIKPLPSDKWLRKSIELGYDPMNYILGVEGKTDKMILEWAFEIIYNQPLFKFFSVQSFDSAEGLSRYAQRHTNTSEDAKKLIALFDADTEGNAQYKGVLANQQKQQKGGLKDPEKNVKCLTLPMPDYRQGPSGENPFDGHIEIEHFFSDTFLEQYSLIGDGVLSGKLFIDGKKVFKIKDRTLLRKELDDELAKNDVNNFRQIFEAIAKKSNNQEFNELVCPDSSNQAVA